MLLSKLINSDLILYNLTHYYKQKRKVRFSIPMEIHRQCFYEVWSNSANDTAHP